MNIERNKSDFEAALKDLVATIETLENVLAQTHLDAMCCVVDEYVGHFETSISELIEHSQELEEEAEGLKREIAELEQ